MDDRRVMEERKKICTETCENYTEEKGGCRLMRPCCREKSWENPYCPVHRWFPDDRYGPPVKTEAEPRPEKKPEPARDPSGMEAYREGLRRRGVEFTEENGKIRITKVPYREMRLMGFFNLKRPCDIPGSDLLRENYRMELEALEKKENGCTSCAKGKLIRKYAPMVKQLMDAAEAVKPS
jgi:hypothetical protein